MRTGERLTATAPDGVRLAVHAWGEADEPEVLLIHGYAQSHLCWARQTAALADRLRLVAFDLRGHGGSDKPDDAAAYRESRRWADDVAAVIAAAGLRRPVLAGWSYGGRVVADYLRHHGDRGIAGIAFVGARPSFDPAHSGPGRVSVPDMFSDDIATNIAGTIAFVRACTHQPMATEDFTTAVAYNMLVPPRVRRALMDRHEGNDDVLAAIRAPVLVVHGLADAIVLPASGRRIAATVPDARASWYEGVGHSPFYEAAERFNAELAAFAAAAAGAPSGDQP